MSKARDFENLIRSMEKLADSMHDKQTQKSIKQFLNKLEKLTGEGIISYRKATESINDLKDAINDQNQSFEELSKSISSNQDDYTQRKLSQELSRDMQKKWEDYKNVMGKLPDQSTIQGWVQEIIQNNKKYDQLNGVTRDVVTQNVTLDASQIDVANVADNFEKLATSNDKLNESLSDSTEELEKQQKILRENERTYNQILGIVKHIWGVVKKGVDQWQMLDEETIKWGRSLGLTEKQSAGFRTRTLNSYAQLSAQFGITAKEILAFQTKYNDIVGTSVQLSTNHLQTMIGVSKFVGEQASSEALTNMDKFGASAEIASLYLAKAHEQASLSGLNAKKTSESFAKNVKMASQYTFREGINGVSKMTMLSEKLKFNMESLGGVIDKFSTIEGAIENSAKLQVLGGQFAQAFGNPLDALHDALIDAEGFTERVVGSFQNLAYFDKNKGMMDMSPLDKMRLRQAAQQMGLSFDEAWNMATQKGKAKEISRNISSTITDQKDKDYITNNAVYDGKDWVINYTDTEGNEISKKVAEIDKETLKIARNRASKEDIMSDDIRTLREYVVGYIKEQGYISQKEKQAGLIDAAKTTGAKVLDKTGAMGLWGDILSWGQKNPSLSSGLLIGSAFLGPAIGYGIKKAITKYGMNGIKNGAQSAWNGAKTSGKKALSVWKNIPTKGKWGIAIATLATLGVGYAAYKGGQGDKKDLNSQGYQPFSQEGRESIREAIESNPEIQLHNDESISEQKKTNIWLEKIFVATSARFGHENEARQLVGMKETTNAGSQIDQGIKNAVTTTAALQWAGGKVIGKQGSKAIYKTLSSTLGKNVAKGILKGPSAMLTGPLGWTGMAVGAATDIGSEYLKANGHEDVGKIVGAVGRAGEYALYGAALGSVIPIFGSGVGAAVGGAIGIIEQYGDEIKKFTGGAAKVIKDFGESAVQAVFGGGDSRNDEEKADEVRETMKFGRVGVDDQLSTKRDIAILKMHDLLISIWYHMNGKQSNGKEKEGSWLNPITWGKKVLDWLTGEDETKQKVDIQQFATGGVIQGPKSVGDNIPVKATAGEAVITPEQFANLEAVSNYAVNQISRGESVGRIGIVEPKLPIGERVEIKSPSVESPQIESISHNVSVNLSGSIKLEANGGNAEVNAEELLKNSQFMKQLIDMVQRSIRLHNTNGMGDTKSGVGFSEFKSHQVRM